MGYRRISKWLNEYGYKTTRGDMFKNTHIYSILKKKQIVDEKMIKTFEPKNENLLISINKLI
jgi:hypothetical protein